MKKRGNIVRAPRDAPGLLMIEGRQFQFSLNKAWQSEFPPRSGQLVEVELSHELAITTITPVPESITSKVDEVPACDPHTTGPFKKFVAKLRTPKRS